MHYDVKNSDGKEGAEGIRREAPTIIFIAPPEMLRGQISV